VSALTTTSAAKVLAGNGPTLVLQRKCACGNSASELTGECTECQREKAVGLQRKLAIGAANDPLEHEADRVAEQVIRMSGEVRSIRPLQRPLLSRRAAGETARSETAPASVHRALQSAGDPLPRSLRDDFALRFGHDFARVRVHHDAAAARSARDVAAHAYTLGEHIVFGAGLYVPGSAAGRQLIAHELAHVLQQRPISAAVLQRASDPSAEAEPEAAGEPVSTGSISMEVTVRPYSVAYYDSVPLVPGGGEIDFGTVYAGDVLLIRRFDTDKSVLMDEVTWTLPPELERLEAAKWALQVRVAATAMSNQTVSIGLVDASGVKYSLKLTIGSLPSGPEAVHAKDKRRRERAALRAERRDKREAYRAARRSVRQASRAERRAARAQGGTELRDTRRTFRAERRAARAERRAERRELRERARALREMCSENVQIDVQTALKAAIARTARALSRLRSAEALSDPSVRDALVRYMNWTPGTAAASETRQHLTRIIDTLVVARNSMTLARYADFDCSSAGCDENTGLYVGQGHRKRGRSDTGVGICPLWISGGLTFPVASGLDEARAYALLHEFVHKSGAFAAEKNRFYVGRNDWRTLSAVDTLSYADGYAALAWTLGQGGKGAP
jgi:hypothetical protein